MVADWFRAGDLMGIFYTLSQYENLRYVLEGV